MPGSSGLLVLSAIAVHASFTWAFVRQFSRPHRLATRTRLLGMTGLVCQIVHLAVVIMAPADMTRRLIAIALYFGSLCLFESALAAAGRARVRLALAFSATPSTELATAGPYRHVRHPIYLSYLLAWAAGSIGSNWPYAWLALIMMGVQYARAASLEERELEHSSLESAYRRYRRQTPGWIPVGSLTRGAKWLRQRFD